MAGRLDVVADGVLKRVESELPDGARLESELLFADDTSFREHGTLRLALGNDLRFRTLGTGELTPTPDPRLRHGTVTWELDGGTGRFAHASGRITSNFTVATNGAVDDEQIGLVFVPERPQPQGDNS